MKMQQADSADAGIEKVCAVPMHNAEVRAGRSMQGHPSSRLPNLIPQLFAVDGHFLPLSLISRPWLLTGWCLLF